MSFFAAQTATVDLDNGNSVTVRKLTFGDMAGIWNDPALFKGPEETFTRRMVAAVTKLSISAWDGPDFDGRGVSPENINALPMEIIDKIGLKVVDLNMVGDDEGNASGAATKSD